MKPIIARHVFKETFSVLNIVLQCRNQISMLQHINLCARFVRFRGINNISLEKDLLVYHVCVSMGPCESGVENSLRGSNEQICERISQFLTWLHPLSLEYLGNQSTALRARASSVNKLFAQLCFESIAAY